MRGGLWGEPLSARPGAGGVASVPARGAMFTGVQAGTRAGGRAGLGRAGRGGRSAGSNARSAVPRCLCGGHGCTAGLRAAPPPSAVIRGTVFPDAVPLQGSVYGGAVRGRGCAGKWCCSSGSEICIWELLGTGHSVGHTGELQCLEDTAQPLPCFALCSCTSASCTSPGHTAGGISPWENEFLFPL